jgi:hypothetical protein
MSSHDLDRVRLAMQVRWAPARERRVFGGVLDSSLRRERRRRAAQLVALASMAGMILSALPGAGLAVDRSPLRSFTPAVETVVESTGESPVVSVETADPCRGIGGLAGTGGQSSGARGAGSGRGGSAGTG